jgi:hypothetical protein
MLQNETSGGLALALPLGSFQNVIGDRYLST